MWVQFTNTDSAGEPVTSRLTVEYDGEPFEINVASTGRANVPEGLAEQLIESDDYAVEAPDEDGSDAAALSASEAESVAGAESDDSDGDAN